jgi:hypothetical protein
MDCSNKGEHSFKTGFGVVVSVGACVVAVSDGAGVMDIGKVSVGS